MNRRRSPWPWLSALLLAGFGFALLRLLQMRFETGDIYPPYSSLRVDPLGTRALFDSLERLPELVVSRHFRPLTRLPEGRRAKKVQLLVSGQTPRTEESAGHLTLTVPSILVHEVVAIDL